MRKFLARDENEENDVPEETVELPREVVNLTTVLVREVDVVQGQLNDLHNKFDSRLQQDDAKEQLFNQLYDDMQARRREQFDDHLLPLVRSILLVIDRIDAQDGDATGVSGEMATLRDELLDALYAVGVEPVVVAPDSRDSRLQRVVETTTTGDRPWVERKPGFVMGTRVVRPQQIAVREDVTPEEPA